MFYTDKTLQIDSGPKSSPLTGDPDTPEQMSGGVVDKVKNALS